MGKERLIERAGDYTRSFLTQDGEHYRHERQDMTPVIRRTESIRELEGLKTRQNNPSDRRYVGSIPMVVLVDWLKANGYTIDQFARNDGGNPYQTDHLRGGGVKDKFLKYFFSRDFCKLHNQHLTTRRERSQIVVPNITDTKHDDQRLRKPEGGDR